MKDFFLSRRRVGNTRSVMSETAPTTPVKDMPDKKRCGRLMRLGQYSSSPSLDKDSSKEIVFDCSGRYFYKNGSSSKLDYDERQVTSSSQDENTQACNISDRVLQRFCKSFSLRFLKKTTSNDGDVPSNVNAMNVHECDDRKKQTYRFGPLTWRCSKERKNKSSTTPDLQPTVPNSLDVIQKPIESKPNPHPSIRRTLSDLNGYGDIVKEKAFNATASSKCKSSIPALSKKSKQYKLRRTNSQPMISSRYSPLLRKTTGNVMVYKAAYSEDERALFSEDEMLSDSGSSLPSRKTSLEKGINDEVVILAEAVWDHIAMESQELPFEAGDVIQVYNVLDRDWWWGMANGKSGWFPSDFVRLRVNQEESLDNFTTSCSNKRPLSVATYSSDEIRSKIVCELINTERDFVRVLQDITESFVRECRYADNLFSASQICTIFGNWEELTAFQFSFLQDLECNIDWASPCKSCLGNVFLCHRKEFYMYSDYCNNHPVSMATLQQLYQKSEYRNFFEKCRLKGGLIEIPLDGFLLTPVQRICKYPLQLAELLKYTETDHADYEYVKEALETMRDVAVLINERKRRMESLEKLILWQLRVDGWMGVDVVERSCQLIHQGDVTKLLMGTWCTNVTLFLFDYQLIYCKKDIIKRDHYVYKGRITLSSYEVIDLPDGKDSVIGINVRNGIKVHSFEEDNFLLFCCRSHKDKMNWLDAFEREKQLVCQDRSSQLQITSTDRSLAYITANTCTRRHSFVKHRNKKFKRTLHGSENRRAARSSYLLGRRMGNWFMFGANRKPLTRSRIETNIT